MTGVFEARYPGHCAAGCGYPIEPADLAAYVDGQVMHAHCAELVPVRHKPEVVCQTCWLVQPCECEES